jgi:hypothetical protein
MRLANVVVPALIQLTGSLCVAVAAALFVLFALRPFSTLAAPSSFTDPEFVLAVALGSLCGVVCYLRLRKSSSIKTELRSLVEAISRPDDLS